MILLGTQNGLIGLTDDGTEQFRALVGRHVQHLAFDGDGALLALADDHVILGRPFPEEAADDSAWVVLGRASDLRANCLAELGGKLFIGAADARLYLLDLQNSFEPVRVESFDAIPTRDTWDTPWGGPPDVRSLAVIRGERSAVYADIHVGGIVRSFDGGQTWSQNEGSLHRDVHQVSTHPALPDSVFAATGGGFFRSDDRGTTWSGGPQAFAPRGYHRAVVLDADDPELILETISLGPHPRGDTGCEAMIYRSTDGGVTWAPAHDGLPDHFHHNINTHMLAASRTRPGVFAFHDGADRLYYSADGAESWGELGVRTGDASSVLMG